MIENEKVHLIATILWALFGIIVGSLGVISHQYSAFLMATMVAAIAGNSAHLVTMDFNKKGIEISSKATNQQNENQGKP